MICTVLVAYIVEYEADCPADQATGKRSNIAICKPVNTIIPKRYCKWVSRDAMNTQDNLYLIIIVDFVGMLRD